MGRWADIATWVGPTPNEGDGDGRPGEAEDHMAGHVGLVVHIAEGTFDGTTAWERNPAAQVSSHFVVGKDGRVAQMVDTDDRSWCQSDGNATWISVENEGYHTEAPTPAQVEALARLYARVMQVYGTPARLSDSPTVGGLGWHGMGGAAWGGHYDCPGEQFKAARSAVLARALTILTGDPLMALTDTDAKALIWRVEALTEGRTAVADGPTKGEPVRLVQLVKDIQAKVAALAAPTPVPVDTAALAAALTPLLEAAAEAAVRKVLGATDGAVPPSTA